MTTSIYLLRHGQTVGNIEGRFCGHSETELMDLGIAQARAAGQRLRDVPFDAVYASDLSRAARTAQYALEGREDLEVVLEPAFREMHYGEWEARIGREIGKESPQLLTDFFRCVVQRAPGGESIQEVRDRTAGALRRVVEKHDSETVLIVSHGNAIGAMVAELLRLPLESTWSFQFDNTSITQLAFSKSGRLTVLSVNDAAHISGLATAAHG